MPDAAGSQPTIPRHYLVLFVLLTSLFALWGLGNNMTDTLLAAFKRSLSMTDFQTSWIQIAFYGSYFCLAFPAALVMRKFSYKLGVLLGLGMFIVGALAFFPASKTLVYMHFLIALFVLAGGLAILETAANPCVLAMGPAETATRRLNLAQAFNPLGSITGVLLGKFVILANLDAATAEERAAMTPEQLTAVQESELAAVMGPYVTLAVVIVALWAVIAWFKFPKGIEEERHGSLGASLGRLFRDPKWVLGVVAQFFYVGAQIGVWSFTIRYVMENLGILEDAAATYYLVAIVLFSVSRFVCTAIMGVIKPAVMLWVLGLAAAVFCGVAMLDGGMLGCVAVVATSVCMSLMFPTIYGIALDGLHDDDRKVAASGLVMAILGGAVLTAIQGGISTATDSIHMAFVVPLVCFLVVAGYGLIAPRLHNPTYGDEPSAA